MPPQLHLKPFDIDTDDAYHYLLAELSPAILQDIPEPDLGDLNHPASTRSQSNPGLYSLEHILSLVNPAPPTGPLYTSQEVQQLALDVSATNQPNWRSLKIPVKSHLNIDALSSLLETYPDPWVLRGSKFGWPLSRDPLHPVSGVTWPNHASCYQNLEQVNKYFEDEISFGAVFAIGHSPASLSPPITTIPLLCVPKPPSLTKVRVCGDMSFPPGFSINDGISCESYEGEAYRCRLPSIWDYITQIKHVGIEDAVIAKADFSRGYRQIPVDPKDWLLQMFHLPSKGFLMDTRAIFGGRPCSLMMQRTHQALAWASVNSTVSLDENELSKSVCKEKAYQRACSPYIDDSLHVAHRACAESSWHNLLRVFKAVNIQLSSTEGHICPPSRSMRALGFDLDLDKGTVSLPLHKLHEMLQLADSILRAEQVTKHDIKRLLGRISRCIMVIREGRRFIGRLLLLLQGPQLPSNTVVPLPEGAKQDISGG